MTIGRIILLALSLTGALFAGAAQTPQEKSAPAPSREGVRKLLREGRYPEAESLARSLLAKLDPEGASASLETSWALQLLVESLRRNGKAQQSETLQHAERALVIAEKTAGPQHPEYARSLSALGKLWVRRGDNKKALEYYSHSRKILEASLEPDHLEIGRILYLIPTPLWRLGRESDAMPLAKRSLHIREKSLGPDHPDVADSLTNLAILFRRRGDYAQAKPLYERALAISRKARGPDHPVTGLQHAALANALRNLGDNSAALKHYQQSLAIREKTLGPEHPRLVTSLTGVAGMLRKLGRLEESRSHYERAIALREKARGPNHPSLAIPLNNFANLLIDLGETGHAITVLKRALALREKADGPNHPSVGIYLNNLGTAYKTQGDYEKSRNAFSRSLAIKENALGPYHPSVADTLNNFSLLLATIGDFPSALETALRAETIGREHASLTMNTLAERQALLYASSRPTGLDLALSLASHEGAGSGETRRKVWDVYIRARAQVLNEMSARRRTIAATQDPSIARLAAQFYETSRELAELMVSGPSRSAPEKFLPTLIRARQRKEKAEQALATASLSFRQLQEQQRVGFQEVADALPEGAALLAYARYKHQPLPGNSPEEKNAGADSEPAYLAFLLRAGEKHPAVIPLGPAKNIELLVTELRKQVALETTAPGRTEITYRRAGNKLRKLLWDPVAPRLKGVQRVFLVPDGALHLINLAALPVGPTQYLIETAPRFHTLSAERDLVRYQTTASSGTGLLILGNPAYDETIAARRFHPLTETARNTSPLQPAPVLRGEKTTCKNFQTMQFSPLSSTAREAKEIATLWNAGNYGTITSLAGAEANEAALKKLATGKRILHLATHGFFLAENCLPSPQNEPGAARDIFLLSGLALAGANQRGSKNPDTEDNILTAKEIITLDLGGVEWAVLSACDTGAGEIKTGEGVLGLRRAFQIAGVHTVIMSLWPVEDEMTRQWMKELYRGRFQAGLSTLESVHSANLTVLRRLRERKQSTHPFYWASFLAAGDWR